MVQLFQFFYFWLWFSICLYVSEVYEYFMIWVLFCYMGSESKPLIREWHFSFLQYPKMCGWLLMRRGEEMSWQWTKNITTILVMSPVVRTTHLLQRNAVFIFYILCFIVVIKTRKIWLIKRKTIFSVSQRISLISIWIIVFWS